MTAFVSEFSVADGGGLVLERGEKKPTRFLAWTRAQEILRDSVARGAVVADAPYAPKGGVAWTVTAPDGNLRLLAVYDEQPRA